ncbi:MAG: ABC transporter ATP-binding protein [Deltaproteobacteria bacterium]|uniref:ABC transporter ATP-binding protein n=1 Tax=uncultured Desulfosarcina sp. TaxID=218289 RepID=UPI0029C63A0A|nr:ABC transporter ATP-binding protein [uncultured Desulfosarcina sp.]MCB2147398.1 ABC transporter ATP-binding protein [Deltaproteobacteria bacterium]
MNNGQPILTVDHLVATFDTDAGRVRAVDQVSFSLKAGTILGLVGESGCGKSVTALSIMRLLPRPAGVIESGAIRLNGVDLVQLAPDEMHRIRGRRIGMIFQEPMTALNPVHRIGQQLVEVFDLHRPDLDAVQRYQAAVALLSRVGIPEARARMDEYPHQISGGMRQRVMIAMALAGKPDVLIADEPTTALDVTIQAQILELILDLQKETGMAVLFITHALGVIAQICQEVAVMYAGWIVESAPAAALFKKPLHPYTQGLLASMPRLSSENKSVLPIIRGTVPSLHQLPPGCRFQNRCPHVMDRCGKETPGPVAVDDDHWARCFLLEG